VIGAWTTSSLGKGAPGTRGRGRGRGNDADEGGSDKRGRGNGGGPGHTPPGQFTQVSRLGHALVNEVVIGLKDKDGFNASEPSDDVQFLEYVTHPTLPVLIQELFGVPAPAAPRNDLVAVFLTGVPGLNQPEGVRPSEILRLNTETFPVPPASQNPLGVIGGDNAGFPNGRRPGDEWSKASCFRLTPLRSRNSPMELLSTRRSRMILTARSRRIRVSCCSGTASRI
jgi:hypothetical protein